MPRPLPGGAQPRDLLTMEDADSGWRRWREGMELAASQLGVIDSRYTLGAILRSNPFSIDGALERVPVALVAFPSSLSPEGRWTVTVQPRGALKSLQPITAEGQEEVIARWETIDGTGNLATGQRRMLAVRVGPIWGEGDGIEVDLVGELLEDSLLPDGTIRSDEETQLRMVLAVDYINDVLYLDHERLWRREVINDGPGTRIRRRLVQRPIYPHEDPRLHPGALLSQSTTLSCNCPDHLGMEFANWRKRSQATSPLGGPLMPAAVDDADVVARRFRSPGTLRLPADACKHIHATRWALGVPIAEPVDVLSFNHPYWSDPAVFDAIEAIVPSLAMPGFAERLATQVAIDQRFHRVDRLLDTISAAEVASVTPGAVGLAPALVEMQAALARMGRMPRNAVLDLSYRRYRRSWYQPRPVLATEARPGEVWMGRGGAVPETFVGPGATAGEPFLEERRVPFELSG